MNAQLAVVNDTPEVVLEAVVVGGDLSKLSPAQRVQWYRMRCEAAGLDPNTQPFQYITLQSKLTLYATKTATEQLCAVRHISTSIIDRQRLEDIYIVTCRAATPDGRFTESTAAVTLGPKKGDDLCNALMKAETKAKRRAVLSLCGMGMMDETETETIPGAQVWPGEFESVRPTLSLAPGVHAAHSPDDRRAKEEDVLNYEAARTRCIERGLTPPGTISLGGPLWKLEKRMAQAIAQCKAYDETPIATDPIEGYGIEPVPPTAGTLSELQQRVTEEMHDRNHVDTRKVATQQLAERDDAAPVDDDADPFGDTD